MKWERVRLEDVCEIVGGTTPSTTNKSYWGGDIVWLSPVDLPDVGTITRVTSSQRRITELARIECGLKLLPPGSLVYSTRASIGKIGVVQVPLVTNQGFTNLIPSDSVDVRYLAYTMKYFTPEIEKLGNSTTFKEVSRTAIRNFKIPLPPLSIQKQIADTLDKADALRRKDKQLLQKYDELAQSIFYDMFGDPVRNERGWEKVKLMDLYSTERDGTKCGPFGSALKKDEYVDTGIPVWVMDNICGDEFVEEGCLYITEQKFKELTSYLTVPGDVIISRAGTVGKMCVVDSKKTRSIISTNLIRLSLNETRINPFFFVKLMTYFGTTIGRLKTGADGAFTHMNTGILNSLEFALPPLEEQNRYFECLTRIRQQKILLHQKQSEHLFNTLLAISFN